ncbi:fumarylacetoacetate hydrolase family protein [Amycolatopsis sp. DSM 110486]|uniref:fumarylacetoacetate hydrolase family protein n=1 Tax=Amycolatopsis sp. DSM 110486 TaxID=2865832 RepID=UPI001C69AA99|nr:fumarylacetoacetate hydrolase family protein [Amycolatopsis sp. DSM 110486]QYN22636.1 fumarylacetoacetate hydrolase family protein [Amycolatopsis sp. DSM 110486]
MRYGNINGRAALISGDLALDVEKASDGLFGPDPDGVFENWAEFAAWARGQSFEDAVPFTDVEVGPPVLRPAQIFGIGLNYDAHAAEAGLEASVTRPAVFTKFVTSITGPYDAVRLPSASVDWEVELVVVIGKRAEDVTKEQGWDHVAGLTIGQDLSERDVQLAGPVPQFSLGKSYPGFSPIGPAIVTPDELADRDDLALSCSVGDEVLQDGRTRDLNFSVPALVSYLSSILPLLPGDVIFTGTPAGVGMGRDPQRYLVPGTTLVSEIEGIGRLRNDLVAD